MADKMKKVRPGEPLRIPAGTFNTFIDTARDYLNRTHGIGRGPVAGAVALDTGTVLVRNDTGVDVDRFGVLGVDSIVIAPTDNPDEFKSRPILSVVTPVIPGAHSENFVVLAEPLPHEATEADRPIGQAVIDGVTVAVVNVQHADHECAVPVNGTRTNFNSAAIGPVRIIYKEAGTGYKWALVRLGARAVDGMWVQILGNLADGTNRYKYAWEEVYKATGGYGGWATRPGGQSGTTGSNPIRNTLEDMNSESGMLGTGVDADHLDTDDWIFTLTPIPTDAIVWARPVVQGSNIEIWIDEANGVDGECK